MTRQHPDIATVEQLQAAGWERIVEVAAHAKTRVKAQGLRAASGLSVVEIAAMVIVLDFHLRDHPDATPRAAPARVPADKPPSAKGTEL